MNYSIKTMYFSATGTTEKVVKMMSIELASHFENSLPIEHFNFTMPEKRTETISFDKDDVVLVGIPVYAGRVPNVLLKFLNTVKSNGALAIAVVLYGNRNYDDALIELKDILEFNGFNVIAASAFIGEHSFSDILAKGRPDEKDYVVIKEFTYKIYRKIIEGPSLVAVPGHKPYRPYYKPKDEHGNPVDIRKVKPKTNNRCTNCGICASVCPMDSIDKKDPSYLNGICIKCGACVKKCPVGAKYFDDKDYLRHKSELEMELTDRKKPELFL